jgi:hypothetical protein
MGSVAFNGGKNPLSFEYGEWFFRFYPKYPPRLVPHNRPGTSLYAAPPFLVFQRVVSIAPRPNDEYRVRVGWCHRANRTMFAEPYGVSDVGGFVGHGFLSKVFGCSTVHNQDALGR